MKLTTATLIIIAAIKWTLQSSHPHKDVNIVNGDGITQGYASRASVIVRSSGYCQSEEDKKKIVQILSEHAYHFSGNRKPMKIRHFFGRFSKQRLEEQQISKKSKMDEESSALPIEKTIKENNAESCTVVLDETNSSTEERRVSQQRPSELSESTMTKDNSMECAESSQEKESNQKRNLKKPSQGSIEVVSEKRVKMNKSPISYIADIQSNPEKSLNTPSESTNSYKSSENIWSWIKNQVIQKKTVYTDFCTPQIYNETLKSKKLIGYYNGFADDLKEYMQEHRPRTEAEKKDQEAENECSYKYRLGDIYMKQELNSKSIKECLSSSEKRYDHKLLENRIKTIFNTPEIYQDLKSMPDNTFTETLENAKKSKDSLTPTQVAFLEYLYRILHCEESECKKEEICVCDKYLSLLENAIILTGREPSSYTIEELYKEAYEAMIIFYKNADYSYENEDKKNIIEMMGKDVIVEQVCMKCEAIVAKNGDARNSPYRIAKRTVYTAMSHHWDISTKIPDHYHIQFVDNSLHTLKRVCLPIFRFIYDATPSYFHTISDIIEYLERIYNIEEKGKIYPLKIEKNNSK